MRQKPLWRLEMQKINNTPLSPQNNTPLSPTPDALHQHLRGRVVHHRLASYRYRSQSRTLKRMVTLQSALLIIQSAGIGLLICKLWFKNV
jgi:hypothetical protein